MAPGRPKPIEDHPFVIRNVRGSCTVHWLAIWCVCAPTSKERIPSLGVTSRTTSMASWAAKCGTWGRRAFWYRSFWRKAASEGHS